MSTATPLGSFRPVNGSSTGVLDPAAQFQHPVIVEVGDVEVAGGVHRHVFGQVEAVERQLDLIRLGIMDGL